MEIKDNDDITMVQAIVLLFTCISMYYLIFVLSSYCICYGMAYRCELRRKLHERKQPWF